MNIERELEALKNERNYELQIEKAIYCTPKHGASKIEPVYDELVKHQKEIYERAMYLIHEAEKVNKDYKIVYHSERGFVD